MTPEEPGERSPAGPEDPSARERLEAQLAQVQARLDLLVQRTERVSAIAVRTFKVLLPFAIFGGMLAFIYVFYPHLWTETLARLATSLVFGKFSAVGGQEEFIFWTIVLGTEDAATGLFLAMNFDLVYRVPWIGPRFARAEKKSATFLKTHGWVRRAAFLGITIVVIVPFQGTGAVMGSFLGRLLGLGPWRAFLAIAIGAYTGIALVLSGSAAVVGIADLDPRLGIVLVVLIVCAAVLMWHRFFRTRKPA